MIVATALVAVVVFAVAMWFSGVIGASTSVIGTAHGAVDAMRDRSLDDRGRERALQQASLRLFGSVASILGRLLLALGLAALPILAMDAIGLGSANGILRVLTRWDFIVFSTAAIGVVVYARTRLWPSS